MQMFRRFSTSRVARFAEAAAQTAFVGQSGVGRETLKPLNSRKTFLVDLYSHLLKSNAVVLACHNSTLLLPEDRQLRVELGKVGAQLTIVRSSLMRVALRGIHSPDAAALSKRDPAAQPHPMAPLFAGPSAIITIPELDPAKVDKCISLIDKSQNKLVLLGGQVHGMDSLLYRTDLDELRALPTLPELQAQLAGVLTVLGGAGLTQTLESSAQHLTLALENRPE